LIYEALNLPVMERVPRGARRVLDLGCGTGALGRELKARGACEVVGVTGSDEEAALAASRLDEVLVRDLNEFDPRPLGRFDCVVCSHALEHLYRPERLLSLVRENAAGGGALVVALPNVLHWRQRLEFFRGSFRYTEGGLMDRTHFRFYDWTTARALLAESGWAVTEREACGGFPLSRLLPLVGPALDRAALRLSPGMFGFQFVLVARPE
jgi:SAM-dependent methyltransferase